jgi:hypothetical protein
MEWIPWDYNLAFSTYSTDLIIDYPLAEDEKPLVKHLQEDPELRSAFFDHACILMDNYFTIAHLDPYITETAALIRPHLNSDPNKFFTIGQFDNSVDHDITAMDPFGNEWPYKGLRQFINERQQTVAAQLANYGHSCTALGIDDPEITAAVVFPNPFSHDLTVRSPEIIDRIEVYSAHGQLVQTVFPGEAECSVSLQGCPAGAYIVRVFTANNVSALAVSKCD